MAVVSKIVLEHKEVNKMATLSKIVLIIALGFVEALAFQLMWGWFVTTPYGVPVPNLFHIMGFSSMIGVVTSSSGNDNYFDRSYGQIVMPTVYKILGGLATGFVVRLFM